MPRLIFLSLSPQLRSTRMWRTKSPRSTIHIDVCLRVPKRTNSTQSASLHKSTNSFSVFRNPIEELKTNFDQYAKRNNLSSTDWYQVSSNSFDERTQELISKHFEGSLYRALSSLFPEIEWKAWKFQHFRVPRNFWKDQSNPHKFFDDLGKELGIKNMDDWTSKLSQHVIIKNGGSSLLRQHNNSPIAALMAAYPEHNWIVEKPSKIPVNYWDDKSNHRKFFDELGKQLGVQTLDDWYSKLSQDAIIENSGGIGLLSRYGNSPFAALMAVYPEHNWIPWKFKTVPPRFWSDKSNHRKFFDWLGKQLGVEKMDDWYEKLSQDVINKHGGCHLLRNYENSAVAALMSVYPEHNWIPWKFNMVPLGYWNDKSNHRKFFDWLGKQLGVETLDDWYSKLSKEIVAKHGGGRLVNKYQGSPTAALMAAYPEHNWILLKFSNVPLRFWNSKDNVRQFLNELSEKLSIQTLDDWYLVSVEILQQLGATGLIDRYKGVYNILKEQYPHHPWDPSKFKQRGKKTQRWLAITLKKIFPKEEILEDYLHPKAFFPSSKRSIQLDIYIPSRSLAFEYQGEHHYQDIGIFSPAKKHQQRDEEKRAVCAANNIKLIEVPYWWKRTQEDLQEIIQKSGLVLSTS